MASTIDSISDEETLDDIVKNFQQASSLSVRRRDPRVVVATTRLIDKIYAHGLPSELLKIVLDIITKGNGLGQPATVRIIRNLYPKTKVNNECLLKVVGALGMGQGRPALQVQSWLLKWLIMVWDVLEDQKTLERCYSFLFGLLDITVTRAPVCHLLSLITRRKHVRPFRIQALAELLRKSGDEPQTMGLLRIYKDYYPDVILVEPSMRRTSPFTHPCPEFRDRLAEIQETHAQSLLPAAEKAQDAFRIARKGSQRGKMSTVPEVHTSQAQAASVTLEEIDTVQQFVDNLERIELPDQLIAVLTDPLLQKLIQLRNSKTIQLRIERRLEAFFLGISVPRHADDQSLSPNVIEMLQSIATYADYTKTLPTACYDFLQEYIPEWNGTIGRNEILRLLTYLPFQAYHDLKVNFFQPLEDALLDDSPATLESLLHFYTTLLQNWTFLLLTSPPPSHATTTTKLFNIHVNTLCTTLLASTATPTASSSVLTYYETATTLFSQPSLRSHVHITIPPPVLIYLLHFTPSLSDLSRLCTILARYKKAFEAAHIVTYAQSTTSLPQTIGLGLETVEGGGPDPYPKEYVNVVNGYLMDICNCLWRARAFNRVDTNALGCLLPAQLTDTFSSYISGLNTGLRLETLFLLSYSPVLCSLTAEYMSKLEEEAIAKGQTLQKRHKGPVTQNSLRMLSRNGGLVVSWQDYRVGVLKYLEDKGVPGISQLMQNTMKNLMQNRAEGVPK